MYRCGSQRDSCLRSFFFVGSVHRVAGLVLQTEIQGNSHSLRLVCNTEPLFSLPLPSRLPSLEISFCKARGFDQRKFEELCVGKSGSPSVLNFCLLLHNICLLIGVIVLDFQWRNLQPLHICSWIIATTGSAPISLEVLAIPAPYSLLLGFETGA